MLSKFIMYAMSLGACALAWGCSFDTLEPLSKTSTNAFLPRTEVAPQRTPDQILVIGDISSNPAKKIEQYQPLA
ncbi:MAG: hypothetical protein VKL39_14655, partial [Leptolyngbyaceae bacterium]|nr:hypothetical protein [Leptolyngbyaceae bacterium]